MPKTSNGKISLFTFILLAVALVWGRFLLPRWLTFNSLSILSWDVFGYYLYLPATFIYHDLGIRDFSWLQKLLDTYNPTIGFYQAYMGPAGMYVMKYPMGMSILYSPFFFMGHLYAHLFHYPADGLSLPYEISIAFGSVFYGLAGIYFLRKILLAYFTDGVSAITMVLIVLGTNYFQLTAYDGAMAHTYLFSLYALITWLTIRWHDRPSWKSAIPLGLLLGLCTLVRPTSVVMVLVPLLWLPSGDSAWKMKLELFRNNISQIVAVVVLFFAVSFLQLLYWKLHSGKWVYYSYVEGEKLQWIARHLVNVLVSYRKGWFIYTPMMLFIIPGFIILWKKNRSLFQPVFIFFAVNLLLVSSWTGWWYSGSFGMRALMESYVLVAIPLAAWVAWLGECKTLLRIALSAVMFFFILLNLFQTWQYMNFILEPSRITRAFYWRTFGKTHPDPKDALYLLPEQNNIKETLENENDYIPRKAGIYCFENGASMAGHGYTSDQHHSGKWSLRLSPEVQFSPNLIFQYKQLSHSDIFWIRASAWVYFTCNPEDVKCSIVITSRRHRHEYKYRGADLEKMNLEPGKWQYVHMDYLSPYMENRDDLLNAYFWYRGDKEVYIDDFTLTVFEPKVH
jgi:hypothetical protein